MTRNLERAIARAVKLPPEEQDTLAALILAEIDDARRWDELFSHERSPSLLARLAAEARAEDVAGLTEPIESLLAEDDEAGGAADSTR